MNPATPHFIEEILSVFEANPALAVIEARLRFHAASDEDVAAARQWANEQVAATGAIGQALAQQNRMMAQQRADDLAMNERISVFNGQLSSLGGSPMPYQRSGMPSLFGGPDPQEAMRMARISVLAEAIQKIASSKGDPPGDPILTPSAFEYLTGRLSRMEMVRRKLGPQVAQQVAMVQGMLGNLSGMTLPGMPDPMKMLDDQLHVGAALALPREQLFDACVALHANRIEGLRLASWLAQQEASALSQTDPETAAADARIAVVMAAQTPEPEDDLRAMHGLLSLPQSVVTAADVRRCAEHLRNMTQWGARVPDMVWMLISIRSAALIRRISTPVEPILAEAGRALLGAEIPEKQRIDLVETMVRIERRLGRLDAARQLLASMPASERPSTRAVLAAELRWAAGEANAAVDDLIARLGGAGAEPERELLLGIVSLWPEGRPGRDEYVHRYFERAFADRSVLSVLVYVVDVTRASNEFGSAPAAALQSREELDRVRAWLGPGKENEASASMLDRMLNTVPHDRAA